MAKRHHCMPRKVLARSEQVTGAVQCYRWLHEESTICLTKSTDEKFISNNSSKLLYFKIWGIQYYTTRQVFRVGLVNPSLCMHLSYATHKNLTAWVLS